MKTAMTLVAIVGSVVFEYASAQAAKIVCNGTYEVIVCDDGRVINCYTGSPPYQIDCNSENLPSKCDEKIVAPQLCDSSSTHTGVCCPSGARIGCFSEPPAPHPRPWMKPT